MGFGDGFNKQYPGLENSGSTDIKVTGSLLVTGDLTVLGSSSIGGGGGGGGDVYKNQVNTFTQNQIISGNLDIVGTITAKQFNVITSSVLYESGSTKFGDTSDDTHQFTGSVISSVGFTGSLNGTASYINLSNQNWSSVQPSTSVSIISNNYDDLGRGILLSASSNLEIETESDLYINARQGYIYLGNTGGETVGQTVYVGDSNSEVYVDGTLILQYNPLQPAYGGTGRSTLQTGSLLIGNGTGSIAYLSGSDGDNGKVVTWVSGAFTLTGSSAAGLNIAPNAEGQTLISSGATFIAARPTAGSNIGLDFASGSITVKLSSSLENLTSVSSSAFTGSLLGTASYANTASYSVDAGSALTASYLKQLNQDVYITGSLSASAGITGSFSGSIASSSMITGFVADVQNIAAATGLRAMSGSSNISVTTGQYPTASLNSDINLANIVLTGKITAVTGSFQLLETVSASSLMVGDKYIVIMSGATDHTTLDGSGILWGSGTLDATSYTDLSASAAILFDSGSDILKAYPGLSSSFTGSFYGDGSGLTNIPASSVSNVVKTVSATAPLSASVNGTVLSVALNSGSVNFNSVTVALGASGSIPLVAALNASSSILVSSSSLSGTVNIDLNKTLSGLTSVSSTGLTGSFSGSGTALTNVASSLIYTTAAPALAVTQVVALSGGLVAATAADRLRANGFGVIVGSSSATGYTVQTNNEALVAFSSSNRSLLVTGSEFYVSSSGTASLYEDITGSVDGRYATQIGYLNRVSGSNYYIIISPRPFGLVY
jgi:hypothetical protein